MWLTLFIFLFVLSVAFLVWTRLQDRRYLKSKIKQVMGENLKKEIEEEKSLFEKKKQRFEMAMRKAHDRQKNPKPPVSP